ncbi:MAG: universal stress protein [Cyclobacteriaceae bacterium]
MNKKHILVLIDFKNEPEVGLKSAINIASQVDAEINLLNVIDEPNPSGVEPSADIVYKKRKENVHDLFTIELIKKRKQQISNLIETHNFGEIKVDSSIKLGDFESMLEEYLEDHPTDLIVMTTTGESSLSEWYSGNHAAQAMRIADIPVLAVKDYHPFTYESNLLLLVDIKNYKKELVGTIRNFANLMAMKVHILHIKQDKDLVIDDTKAWMKSFAEDNHFENYDISIVDSDDMIAKIKSLADDQSVDVVASISKTDTGLARLLFGSDTEKVLKEVDDPVLVINDPVPIVND